MSNRACEANLGSVPSSETTKDKAKELKISKISQDMIMDLLTICNMNQDHSDIEKYQINNKKHIKAIKKLKEISSKFFKIFLKFVNTHLEFIFEVIEKNIFRSFPDNITDYFTEDIDSECNNPKLEPEWVYLDGLYDLLFFFIRYQLDIKNLKNYLTLEFITKLVDLVESPNYFERQAIRSLFIYIYESHLYQKTEILKISKYYFMTKIQENYKYMGIDEMLGSHLSIVIRFPVPLKKDHVEFFKLALVPLYGTHFSHLLESNLFTCCHHILMNDLSLAVYLIEFLLTHWPVARSCKELFFLSNLKKLISMFDLSWDQNLFTKIVKRLASCFISPNIHVKYSALLFFESDFFLKAVKFQEQVSFPLIVKSIEEFCMSHWNKQTKEIFSSLKDILISNDSDSYQQALKESKDIKLSNSAIAMHSINNREQIENQWEDLTRTAIKINPSLKIPKVPYRADHVVGLNNRNGIEMTSENLVIPGVEIIKTYDS